MTDNRERRPRRLTRALLIGSAVAVVVIGVGVIVGPRLYAQQVNGSAAAAPTLSAGSRSGSGTGGSGTGASGSSAGAGGLTSAGSTGSWTATGSSFAGYRVHEVLQGQNVNVVGRTKKVAADVALDAGRLSSGTVTVQVGDISTPESARDAYFRGTALQTQKFPEAAFVVTKPVDLGAVLAGGSAEVRVPGKLTLHGVTRSETFDAQVGVDGDALQVVGSIPISFADFGVSAPSLGFVTVDDHGAVEVSLTLKKES